MDLVAIDTTTRQVATEAVSHLMDCGVYARIHITPLGVVQVLVEKKWADDAFIVVSQCTMK